MPTYCFVCKDCEVSREIKCTFAEVEIVNTTTFCDKCSKEMVRDMATEIMSQNVTVARDVLKPEALNSHADSWKVNREAKKAEAIMNEGFESQAEVKESVDMAAEAEKASGKTPGTILGGVQAAATKEQKEAIKQRDRKKKQEQVNLRRKQGFKK